MMKLICVGVLGTLVILVTCYFLYVPIQGITSDSRFNSVLSRRWQQQQSLSKGQGSINSSLTSEHRWLLVHPRMSVSFQCSLVLSLRIFGVPVITYEVAAAVHKGVSPSSPMAPCIPCEAVI